MRSSGRSRTKWATRLPAESFPISTGTGASTLTSVTAWYGPSDGRGTQTSTRFAAAGTDRTVPTHVASNERTVGFRATTVSPRRVTAATRPVAASA